MLLAQPGAKLSLFSLRGGGVVGIILLQKSMMPAISLPCKILNCPADQSNSYISGGGGGGGGFNNCFIIYLKDKTVAGCRTNLCTLLFTPSAVATSLSSLA